jgi:membrane protease subunit HflK
MERNIQRTGVVNLLVLLVVTGGAFALARQSGSDTALASAVFLLLGFLVALVSWFQMRLEAREQLENLEIDELNKNSASAALFESAEIGVRPARRAREQFERVMVPGFTVLFLFLQAGLALVLWKGWLRSGAANPEVTTLVMTLFAIFGIGLFLLGKFSAGLALLEKQRLLRPAAGYLLLNAVLCFVVAGTSAAFWFGGAKVDQWVSRALQVLLAIAALETLVTLILEIYRPRIKGQAARLHYESRLIGMVGQPEGFVRTLAHALDYQFGFKVSETGFYRFIEENLSKLLLGQLVVLLLFTTFAVIEPGEQGLLERFGRPVAGREVLDPGLHFKLPWPVDLVHRHRTFALQDILVGSEPEEEEDGHDHAHEESPVILWTVAHNHEEFNFIVAHAGAGGRGQLQQADLANLLTIGIPIQFEVTNIVHWARRHANPKRTLQQLAFREAVKLMVSVNYDDVLADGRLKAAAELRARLQVRANELELGVRIVFVGVNDVHPPVAVTPAYEEVVAAHQQKQTNILAAEAFRAEKIPAARADAKRKLDEAESYRLARISDVMATAGQFTNQLIAYSASPEVYRQRRYLETLTRAAGPVRKLVIGATNTTEVIYLNLEDKIRADLEDLTVPPVK